MENNENQNNESLNNSKNNYESLESPKTTYTAIPVYQGMTVKQTPLTDEEKAYHDLELTKFAGKPVDKERFEAELVDENNVRTIYENVDITESNDAPF